MKKTQAHPKPKILFDFSAGEIKSGSQDIATDMLDYRLLVLVFSAPRRKVSFLAKRLSISPSEVLERMQKINNRSGFNLLQVRNGSLTVGDGSGNGLYLHTIIPNDLLQKSSLVEGT